jgi:hypothetical protein
MASADTHAESVSAGRGSPVASIPAPPNAHDWISRVKPGVCFERVWRTRTAWSVTSGPEGMLREMCGRVER